MILFENMKGGEEGLRRRDRDRKGTERRSDKVWLIFLW